MCIYICIVTEHLNHIINHLNLIDIHKLHQMNAKCTTFSSAKYSSWGKHSFFKNGTGETGPLYTKE